MPTRSRPRTFALRGRILKNARALPEWMQLEQDIEREIAALPLARERALRTLRAARNAASQERVAQRLRDATRESLDLIGTMIFSYNYHAPSVTQKSFRRPRIQAEMAALEQAIQAAIAEGCGR